MRILVSYKKIPDRVQLPDDMLISRTRLAEELTKRLKQHVSKQTVSNWMRSGSFPLDVIPHLKSIPLEVVQTRIWTRPRKGETVRGRRAQA